jgi:hypothetical protein
MLEQGFDVLIASRNCPVLIRLKDGLALGPEGKAQATTTHFSGIPRTHDIAVCSVGELTVTMHFIVAPCKRKSGLVIGGEAKRAYSIPVKDEYQCPVGYVDVLILTRPHSVAAIV